MLIAAGSHSDAGQTALGLVLIALGVVLYWVPSLVAWRRKPPSTAAVVVVNLFTGWTVIGWVVALAMAFRDPKPVAPPVVTR